jgi:bromodomain-containing factor 1
VAPKSKASATAKSKKNKPMSKLEQERRIAQLNELRAKAGGQASGSQEPMESIEGTGRASADPPAPTRDDNDSEDEESSEEE